MRSEINIEPLIAIGNTVKALGDGHVGGHLILFGDADNTDLEGEYFTPETYFGAKDGDGADVMIQHGKPFKSGDPILNEQFRQYANRTLSTMKTQRDALGIWAETVLNMADEYERLVYELCQRGVFKWSSGTASHTVQREPDGKITRWLIVEGSLTPTPAEPRMLTSRVMPLKDFEALLEMGATQIINADIAQHPEQTTQSLAQEAAQRAEIDTQAADIHQKKAEIDAHIPSQKADTGAKSAEADALEAVLDAEIITKSTEMITSEAAQGAAQEADVKAQPADISILAPAQMADINAKSSQTDTLNLDVTADTSAKIADSKVQSSEKQPQPLDVPDAVKEVSNRPWSEIKRADYTLEQWRGACLIRPNKSEKLVSFEQCKLPVREPDGTLNYNAVWAAYNALSGARNKIDAPAEKIRQAAKQLIAVFTEINTSIPDNLYALQKSVDLNNQQISKAVEQNSLRSHQQSTGESEAIGVTEEGAAFQKSVDSTDHLDKQDHFGGKDMIQVTSGGLKMTLLEAIKKLVPKLSDDQMGAIAAVIELAGANIIQQRGEEDNGTEGYPSESILDFPVLKSVLKDMGYLTPPTPEVASLERPIFEKEPGKEKPLDEGQKKFNAVYETRFGSDDEIKSVVMKDLLGNEYRQLLNDQYNAFWKYMRLGETALDNVEIKLLKTQVFPAEGILGMVKNGIEVSRIKDVMVEAQGTLGGYAVPPAEQQAIVSRLPGLTAVRGAGANVITLTTQNATEFPIIDVSSGDKVYPATMRGQWGSEISTATDQNMVMKMVTIPAGIYTYRVPMSQSLVEDAANLVQILQKNIAETLAVDEDRAFLIGDGMGKPLGILPGGDNAMNITEVNTGNASEMVATGIMKLKRGVLSVYRSGPSVAWIANSSTWGAVESLSANGIFYFPDLSASEKLLNRPVKECEAIPDVAANAYPLLFGDFSGYAIVERLGLTIVRFQDSYTGINKVEYHVRKRVGGRMVEPWKFAVQKVSA